jgi:pimeloyl-ACP methyl ester carboxylesterase
LTQADTLFTKAQDWLVRKGISAEIKKSRLEEDVVHLPFGQISFLRSRHASLSSVPVVLLHVAAADNTSWVRFARHLETDRSLIIPDLPGHGKSVADPALSYSIEAQAGYVLQFLEALAVRQVHLIASSMGGAIALRLAATRPGMIASLVLIGAVGVHAKESWLERHIAETGENPMLRVRTEADYLAMVRIGMNKPPFMPGFVVSSLSRAFIKRARINEKIGKDIASDLDQTGSIAGVSCPVQLILGSDDRVSSVENGREFQRLLKASELSIMDGIGHVPMVEAPKEVAGLCERFLSQVMAGSLGKGVAV